MSQPVLGYDLCKTCRQPVPSPTARVTGGLCGDCALESRKDEHARLEVIVGGALCVAPPGGKRKRLGTSRGSKVTKAKRDKAKMRALRRLRWAHPEEYEMLLGAERAKLGLEPFPLGRMTRIGSLGASSVYDQGDASADCHS